MMQSIYKANKKILRSFYYQVSGIFCESFNHLSVESYLLGIFILTISFACYDSIICFADH